LGCAIGLIGAVVMFAGHFLTWFYRVDFFSELGFHSPLVILPHDLLHAAFTVVGQPACGAFLNAVGYVTVAGHGSNDNND